MVLSLGDDVPITVITNLTRPTRLAGVCVCVCRVNSEKRLTVIYAYDPSIQADGVG